LRSHRTAGSPSIVPSPLFPSFSSSFSGPSPLPTSLSGRHLQIGFARTDDKTMMSSALSSWLFLLSLFLPPFSVLFSLHLANLRIGVERELKEGEGNPYFSSFPFPLALFPPPSLSPIAPAMNEWKDPDLARKQPSLLPSFPFCESPSLLSSPVVFAEDGNG